MTADQLLMCIFSMEIIWFICAFLPLVIV